MTNLKTLFIIIYVALKVNFGRAGIDIPKTECAWINGDYGKEIKCDGNQVVVGACGWVIHKIHVICILHNDDSLLSMYL